VDDPNKVDPAATPRFGLAAQIVRAIVLAALITFAAWIATSYALDWIAPPFR
jgi:hypothetical protein